MLPLIPTRSESRSVRPGGPPIVQATLRRLTFLLGTVLASTGPLQAAPPSRDGLLAPNNLVAWCIVPFDAQQRGPKERAAMVRELGLSAVAYDWRKEHVAHFSAEADAYRKHEIEFFAFWSWHPQLPELVRKHHIRPQVWLTNPSPRASTQQEKIRAAVKQLSPVVRQAAQLKLPIGLYNHGGWGGRAGNLMAVCDALRAAYPAAQVGIVYNFHHAHEECLEFPEFIAQLRPYLLCVNLNGMVDARRVAEDASRFKILPIGQGQHEYAMLQALVASGYSGRIGILDHRPQLDARQSLQENLRGLAQLRRRLATEPKPVPPPPASSGE